MQNRVIFIACGRDIFKMIGLSFAYMLGRLQVLPILKEGILLGFDSQSMSVALGDVKGKQGTLYHRLILTGYNVAKVMATERPFNLDGLKDRLERVFPNMVQYFSEAGVLVVMSKIRVNETGVIEGTGPAADRVQDIYNRFVAETS